LFLATATAYAVVIYFVSAWALFRYFGRGPLTFCLLSEDRYELYERALEVVYPAIPVCACAIARAFGVRAGASRWLLSVGLFLAACPFAIGMLQVTGHIGGADAIHAIKSGFIVPLLVVGLGVPFVPLPADNPPAAGRGPGT